MDFKRKYGPTALIAGASEGLGAAWAKALAAKGLNLVLIARRKELLEKFGVQLAQEYNITVTSFAHDLSDPKAAEKIIDKLSNQEIGFVVYNAALSFVNPFLANSVGNHKQLVQTNIISPLELIYFFGGQMVKRGKGGMALMCSLAGFQGSGFLAAYAASKAYNLVLAESLWYEWKEKGVDVLGCCAGATSTPNYLDSKPAKLNFLAPKTQLPDEVVNECLNYIGKGPSLITGSGNRLASFFMQKVLPRKTAVKIMGNTTRKMYGINT
jgi:short-subunit dehydrogenase